MFYLLQGGLLLQTAAVLTVLSAPVVYWADVSDSPGKSTLVRYDAQTQLSTFVLTYYCTVQLNINEQLPTIWHQSKYLCHTTITEAESIIVALKPGTH